MKALKAQHKSKDTLKGNNQQRKSHLAIVRQRASHQMANNSQATASEQEQCADCLEHNPTQQ
eukprot:5479382-Amphidinium_carterae.1